MKLLILLMALAAPGWGAWSVCKAVTVNPAQVTSGPHSNFKMLVSGTYSWLASTGNGGVMTDAQGDDLRVYSTSDCSTTAIAYQRVHWTNTGVIELWVRVSSMDNGSVVYIGAGDSGVTTDGSNAAGVWAEEQLAYLFPDGSTLNVDDSSASGRNLTNNGTVAIAGKIDGGVDFDTAGDNLTRSGGWSATTQNSFCAWVYPETLDTTARRIFEFGTTIPADQLLNWTTDGLRYNYWWSTSPSSIAYWYTSSLSTGSWHHVCITYDAGSTSNDPAIYVNGSAQSVTEGAAPSGTASAATSETYYIGNRAAGDRTWDGRMDTIIRDDTIWTAGHIATMYANQNAPDTFYTITDAGASSTRRRVIVIQ